MVAILARRVRSSSTFQFVPRPFRRASHKAPPARKTLRGVPDVEDESIGFMGAICRMPFMLFMDFMLFI